MKSRNDIALAVSVCVVAGIAMSWLWQQDRELTSDQDMAGIGAPTSRIEWRNEVSDLAAAESESAVEIGRQNGRVAEPGTGRVQGRAVDVQGRKPVEIFTVSLFDGERILRTNAADITVMFQDETGMFSITDLEHAQMDLLARAGGFQPVIIRGIAITDKTEEVELRFEKATPIAGYVRSAETGDAIPGASVSVRTTQQDLVRPVPFALPGQTTKTRDDGSFSLGESLIDGSLLQVQIRGYLYQSVEIESLNVREIEIYLEPAGSVSGRFTGADGSTPQAGSIRLWHPESGASYLRRSDDEGRFKVINLAPGEYELTGRSPAGQSGQLAFALGDGQHLDDLQLQVQPGNEVVGRVSGLMAGEAVRSVSAQVSRSDWVSSEVDAGGDYKLRGLPIGKVELVASTTKGRSLSAQIELQATSVVYADFVFEGSATVYGTISRSGEPVKNTWIELIPVEEGLPKGSTSTSADGYYVFEGMANSKYRLRVNHGESRFVELNGTTQFNVEL